MVTINFDFKKFKEAISELPPSDFHYRSLIVSQFVWENGIAEVGSLDLVVKDRGPLQADGYGVVLYIKDQGSRIEDVISDPSAGRKVHLAYCKTLRQMEEGGKFERYHLKREPDGLFLVSGSPYKGATMEESVSLSVCKNCLKQLNYGGYRQLRWIGGARDKATRDFDYGAFFENYSSFFPKLPIRDEKSPTGYTADWKEISKSVRSDAKNCCEMCKVDMSSAPGLLHTHHINGVKTDNSLGNLRVLCASCHRRQPDHEHVHLTRRDYQVIHEMRKIQNKHPSTELELGQLIDTAWFQPLEHLKKSYGSKVEPYFDLEDRQNSVICNLTLAFVDKKVGLLDQYSEITKKRASAIGWRLLTHDEALAA
ncbi:HNH endonuclease signature motif containing protein [Pseudomonadales bacterium]|nr:HNH endonuclease signature motif containing protein [Pseudomonadales bacterium]